MEKSEITLKLLLSSTSNPILLAYTQLNSEFDFNRTPMAPPGTITLVHYKPHNRGAMYPHGHEGWYVRPSIIHYRCLISYIPKTSKGIVSHTTEFPPSTLTFPIISSKDAETHAAADLIHTLINPTPTTPLTTLGYKQTAALNPLAEIFNMVPPPQVTPPPRVNTPEATPEASPAPPQRVDPQVNI